MLGAQVTRRKAGTLSGRCRSNEYVPKNPEVDGFYGCTQPIAASYLVSGYRTCAV